MSYITLIMTRVPLEEVDFGKKTTLEEWWC